MLVVKLLNQIIVCGFTRSQTTAVWSGVKGHPSSVGRRLSQAKPGSEPKTGGKAKRSEPEVGSEPKT